LLVDLFFKVEAVHLEVQTAVVVAAVVVVQ
jgi:hypothetical protein